jgi:RND family efflux transporter MFP subunit
VVKNVNPSQKNTVSPQVQFSNVSAKLYPATYSEVDTQADANTLSYKVTLTMEKPEEFAVLPGMSVNVILNTSKQDQLSLPVHALIEALDPQIQSNAVWLFDPQQGVVNRRQVQVINYADNQVVIHNDFADGEKIVLTGVKEITEGKKVREWIRERGL